jgi:serine/threonine-protein kinase
VSNDDQPEKKDGRPRVPGEPRPSSGQARIVQGGDPSLRSGQHDTLLRGSGTAVPDGSSAAPVRRTPAPRAATPVPRARETHSGHSVTETEAGESDPYINTVVADRYRVQRKLGEGGMGVVYLAEHVFIEKPVAIKILADDFARKADLVARFMQEAKAASKIGHENIIDITDFGETASGSVFFVMEFLDGGDLAHHIRQSGPMPFPRVRYIMNQICRALGAAHSKGIIHRDLKPENIYLIEREGKPDFVKILDFGIAKMNALDSEGGARLTRTGMIFGTPEYMSPEQARGDRPDHRVDIYAAGCILYEMLTGDVPFHAESFMGVLTKHMFETPEPPSVRCPEVPIAPEVEAVVLRALAKDREQRFQTMKEMALALEACIGGNPMQAWGSEGSGMMPIARDSSAALRISPAQRPVTAAGAPSAQMRGATPVPLEPTEEPQRSRGWLAPAVALGVLALAGVLGVAYLRKPAPLPQVVAPPPAPAPRVEPPPPVPTVTPMAVAPAAPTTAKMTVRTQPPGADVYNGFERLGATPGPFELPSSTNSVELTLKKKGYADKKLSVVPDHDREFDVELRKSGHDHSATPRAAAPPRNAIASPAATPDPTPPPPKPAEPKPAGKLRDLKDPFAN